MSKSNNPTVFEMLGYGKYDAKPAYTAYSLVKTAEGWVVFEISMRGLQVEDMKIVCQPTVKAHAAERLRILTAHYIREGSNAPH